MVQYFIALLDALKTREDEGQGMVEYALILVLVSIAAVVALTAMGDLIGPIFDTVSASL
ncbi:MAG TPA: Flp family type IVb pilin [Thermomicrobiales bacterium]|nr:Flp family type IVb pilin [Thermomicrobiales bacterium]